MKCTTLLVVAVLVLSACGKKSGSASVIAKPKPGETPSGTALPPPPQYIAATARNAPEQNVVGEVNTFLTEQLRIFIREKGRLLENFTEFTRARLDSVPRPPEGRRWVIDAASREVKAALTQ